MKSGSVTRKSYEDLRGRPSQGSELRGRELDEEGKRDKEEYTLVAASTTMKSVLRMDARQGQVFVGPSDPINTSSQSGLSVNKFQLNLPPLV